MDCQLPEMKIFTENYAKLCDTLTDIDSLLKYFVQADIIKGEQELEISNSKTTSEKVKKLLIHISGPLKSGNSDNFYTMLDIMKKQGAHATKELASFLKESALTGNIVSASMSVTVSMSV